MFYLLEKLCLPLVESGLVIFIGVEALLGPIQYVRDLEGFDKRAVKRVLDWDWIGTRR